MRSVEPFGKAHRVLHQCLHRITNWFSPQLIKMVDQNFTRTRTDKRGIGSLRASRIITAYLYDFPPWGLPNDSGFVLPNISKTKLTVIFLCKAKNLQEKRSSEL